MHSDYAVMFSIVTHPVSEKNNAWFWDVKFNVGTHIGSGYAQNYTEAMDQAFDCIESFNKTGLSEKAMHHE